MKKILIRYGEISLKGKNRERFIDALVSRLREALDELNAIKVSKVHGRIFVQHAAQQETEVFRAISKTFGIVSFSPVDEVDLDLDAITSKAILQMERAFAGGLKTFKVESRRSNKGFPLKSPELSREIGGRILSAIPNLKVDVHEPQITLNIEIRNRAYVFSEVIRARGGMPYGVSGKGLVLLSGGIDSPVAAYMMAKRGMYVEALHFHSQPYTSERAKQKVLKLAEKLCEYTKTLTVSSVNLAEIQSQIRDNCPSEEMTVISRRFMMRIASAFANKRGLKALVTGESLAQVASQTLEGMVVIEDAASLPVFKPLIAFDKVDTIEISKDIDCFETSILPYEDCCTVFLPDRVVTRPRLDKIIKSEESLDIDELVERAFETLETIEVKKLGSKDIEALI